MVTITAPGVEINELDLSFYNFPQPKEETQNVFITGFAAKGHTNSPYEFTNKNTDDDLINTFGTPTNEVERYFFNACSEAIKRDKVVLYAARLPYANNQSTKYNVVEYKIDSARPLSTFESGIGEHFKAADITLSNAIIADVKFEEVKIENDTIIDEYRLSQRRPADNHFIIVDKNQELYGKIPEDAQHMTLSSRYMLGILPVVTTATNAMFYQKIIANEIEVSTILTADIVSTDIVNIINDFNPISSVTALDGKNVLEDSLMVYPAASDDSSVETISKTAMAYFTPITNMADGSIARDRLKNIGIVVFKGFIDPEEGNKIKYEPIESFVGSLKQDDVDPVTGNSRFIDDIVNTNSQTIELFSNCFNAPINTATELTALTSFNDISSYSYSDITLLKTVHQHAAVLGHEELAAADKVIDTNLIATSLDKIFEKNKNINEKQIDLVVDAGVSNIAQFMTYAKKYATSCKTYDPMHYTSENDAGSKWDICDARKPGSGVATSMLNSELIDTWAKILKKYDSFCKARKDCMFLADGLRPLCVIGNRKIVTKRNFKATIGNSISPFIKYISGKVDTSYGTGNCDWYQICDPTSGVNMWMPPSVKTMDALLDATNNKFYWTVPAGVNNGLLNPYDNPSNVKVIDIAFNPTVQEAGDIYTKSWNYMTYHQDEGFCLEGQRTFQSRPTAFDRINVRRLFLYLERKVAMAAKYFIYEGNTAYNRQRLIDVITPYFEHAKINGGLFDYRLQCDDKNNTPDTIDRNELHVKVAIKPTKAIEFIECTFVALRTGASFTEAGMND